MKSWFTANEIATMALPGLPASKRNVNRLAETEGWKDRLTSKGEPLARIRAGRDGGGGLEYHISLLPPEARAQLSAQAHKINTTAAPVLPQPAPAATNPERVKRRDARLAVLVLADAHYAANRALGRVAADADFCLRYNDGRVSVEAWLRSALPRVSARSLTNWRKDRDSGNWHLVGGKGRVVKSILEAANDGAVATRIAAYILNKPHISAFNVREMVLAEFGDRLLVNGSFVDVPHERSFQRHVTQWREDNKVSLTQFTNPDSFKSAMQFSGSNMYADITRVNQRWEIDASPADVLLKEGRHSIYLITDIFSRRIIVHTSKTPRTEASLYLVRKAILAWGYPEVLVTDNGSDFVSEAFMRAMMAVGIQQKPTARYSPQQKAGVERVIGTMQRQFIETLPGYVGHNVTDRKQIEERKAFANRLGEKDENIFCVDIELRDTTVNGVVVPGFQTYCDDWAKNAYGLAKHSSLNGMSPAQKAASCMVPLRTCNAENIHGLDVLLSPVSAEWRVVTKRGIQWDGAYYLAGSLLPGQRVYCRPNPDNFGQLLCFNDDAAGFLCVAECAERLGVSPVELFAVHKKARKELLDGLNKEAKAQARAMKPRHFADSLRDLNNRRAMAEATNVSHFPKREVEHTTPALEGAARAVEEINNPAFERLFQQVSETPSKPVSTVVPNDNVVRLPAHPKQVFRRAIEIRMALEKGLNVSPEDARWLGSYEQSPQYKTLAGLYAEHGSEWLNA